MPHDDPTLLFTNAGMNQFKDVFLGKEKRDYTRATTAQKMHEGQWQAQRPRQRRAVVPASHVLRDAWEFLLRRLLQARGDSVRVEAADRRVEASDPIVVWATIFNGERRSAGRRGVRHLAEVPPVERIGELGAADNFWQMGDTGPCGRCSEIYFVRGGGVCRARVLEIEIWNNVFMEFDRQANGTLTPLPAPSIDTGMGLERVTAVIQGHLSNYDTDLFTPLLGAIGERAGTTHHGTMEPSDVSMRVVADHMRAMTFLIADGVVPSNEMRGYVLRKIMRRAMRHGQRLGVHEPFLHTLVDVIVREFGEAYPELKAGRSAIVQVVRSEEERFDAVLTDGLPKLEDVLDKAAARAARCVSGDVAFRLYDTYGLPRDFIEDMIEDRKLSLDREGFERAMEGQREKARAGSKFKGGRARTRHLRALPGSRSATTFAGTTTRR